MKLIHDRVERDYATASRANGSASCSTPSTKNIDFELPEGHGRAGIRPDLAQVEAERSDAAKQFRRRGHDRRGARAEYRKIAERRVRLGLVLAEIGEKAGVKVADDEVSARLFERARPFPGQEKLFWDYYQKNPQALAEIRAPIYEEKVVDHIVGFAKVTDKTVSKEELFKVEDEVDSRPDRQPKISAQPGRNGGAPCKRALLFSFRSRALKRQRAKSRKPFRVLFIARRP